MDPDDFRFMFDTAAHQLALINLLRKKGILTDEEFKAELAAIAAEPGIASELRALDARRLRARLRTQEEN